uniref:Uncharacterized protein n=1 Tax=viral metagenome TaxID=1070528 RepID=A0A6M3J2T0_9ZZZZ
MRLEMSEEEVRQMVVDHLATRGVRLEGLSLTVRQKDKNPIIIAEGQIRGTDARIPGVGSKTP